MGATLFHKIWERHVVGTRGDGRDLIYMDRHVLHELHGPHAFKRLAGSGRTVRRPDLTFGVMDHSVATVPGRTDETNPESKPFAVAMQAAADRYGMKLFGLDDPNQGIGHVIAPELGIVLPGTTYACPDSHACTVGGLGALAFACGTSELEHVLATQVMALRAPKQMRVRLEGSLAPGVTAKDVILHLIGMLGVAGGRGFAVEYCGPVVEALSIEARLTLCNMTIEMGARTGLVAPDEKTFTWLAGRPMVPRGAEWERALAWWRTLRSDPDAAFDRELTVDCGALQPQVTWGTDQSQVVAVTGTVPEPQSDAMRRALDYMGLTPGTPIEGLPVDRVFIGSCTNARVEDLLAAAAVVRGKRVAERVLAFVVPGSSQVKRDAEALGLDAVFRAAGFAWHESGCSMCAGGNGDLAAKGERCVSTSNRNFENRQGPGVRTHLVSPEMAAAAAIEGRITDVRRFLKA
jgi:3-isopropylmalate/(R)-2-methylmalate dehydratase large subunit